MTHFESDTGVFLNVRKSAVTKNGEFFDVTDAACFRNHSQSQPCFECQMCKLGRVDENRNSFSTLFRSTVFNVRYLFDFISNKSTFPLRRFIVSSRHENLDDTLL